MKLSAVDLPTNRKFGFFFTFVFCIAALYFFLFASVTAGYVMAAIAVVFLMVTLTKPDILLPLNKLWMTFGLILGVVLSPIVLGVIFFGIFTPIAFCMRLFGRDELRLKHVERPTYWKTTDPDADIAASFSNQY